MMGQGTAVVAGGAGFLGGYAAKALVARGWSVCGVDRSPAAVADHPAVPRFADFVQDDLGETGRIVDLLAARKPDLWLHLAGPASVAQSFGAPLDDFSAGVLPLLRVLDAIRLSGSRARVLLASSAAVYGEPDALPVRESHPIRPISPYGFHKRCQELLLDEYGRLFGLRTCAARIFSTYGPGMRQLAVWDITRRALAGDSTVFGSGLESRDYLFAADVADALACIGERAPFRGEAVNVASGVETRIVDVAQMIHAQLGLRREPQLRATSRPGVPTRWCADVARLASYGFSPGTGLAEGIARTVCWIEANG